MGHTWLWLASAFFLGSVAPLWCAVGALGLALLWARRRPGLSILSFALAAGALAGSASAVWWASQPAIPQGALEGQVTRLRYTGDRVWVDVAPDAHPAHQVRVVQKTRDAGLAPGARVRVEGPFRAPEPQDNPGSFNAQQWLGRQGIAFRAQGPVFLRRAAGPAQRALVSARVWVRSVLHSLPSSQRDGVGAGLLFGLVLGDRAAVPEVALEALEGSGLSHLISVSGLHIGGLAFVVFALVSVVGNALGLVWPQRLAGWLALVAAVSFVLLAQQPLPAVRAGVMVSLGIVGRRLARQSDGLQMIGLAAFVVLASAPESIFEPAFQLSFGAVFALIFLPIRAPKMRWGWAVSALGVACVAAYATAPFQAWHFGTFAPVAPIANIFLTPFASMLVVPMAALGLLCAPLWMGPLSFAAQLADFLVCAAQVCAGWSDGVWVVGAHAAGYLALPILCAVLWKLWPAHSPRMRWGAAAVLAGLCVAWSAWRWPRASTVDVVAVGQGDAILVRSGLRAILVDTGPDPEARALKSLLRHWGIRRLEAVILSHRHPDHFLGLHGLLGWVPIETLWDRGGPGGSEAWWRLHARVVHAGVPVRAAQDDVLKLGALTLRILASGAPEALSENDRSIAVRVEGPKGSVLLSGDLEVAGEARLIERGQAQPVTVLKAPHHGSRTSSTPALLDALCPQAVIFSLARENRYGFVHPEVDARYAQRGIARWRSDHHGLVQVRLDGPVEVRSHRGPQGVGLHSRLAAEALRCAPAGPRLAQKARDGPSG